MAGSIQGWAVMAGGQEESGDISYEDVEEALSSTDPKKIKETLQVLAAKGEIGAADLGYAYLVGDFLASQDQDIAIAAIEALGKMGSGGAMHAADLISCLRSTEPQIQAVAAEALGNFGKEAAIYKDHLMMLVTGAQDEIAKASAIMALGKIGADSEVDKIADLLENSQPLVAAAACQALGLLGEPGLTKADLIASKLDDPSIKYAALCALKNLGRSAVRNSIDKIIYQCLADKDLATREVAGVALGTAADDVLNLTVHMEKITNLLGSQEPGTRCAAALALGHLGARAGEKWSTKLEGLLDDDAEDFSARALQMGGIGRASVSMRKPQCAAISALGMMSASKFAGKIKTKLVSDDWEVRLTALQALAGMGEAALAEQEEIAELLTESMYLLKVQACKTLGAIDAEDSAEAIKDVLEDKSPSVRAAAATALGQLGSAGAVYSSDVFKLLKSPLKQVRVAAISSLGNMEEIGECYAGPIATFLEDDSLQVRCASIEALGKLGSKGAAYAEEISMFLEDPASMARSASVKALGQMGSEAAPYHFKMLALTEDPLVAEVAKEAMESLEG
mmetsp:Transcript_98770/g.171161  ORF Transcript_98770/g.171161 Transcript_98770/m.171161 type:complete len:566 (+) Transcript_98770:71-1768(+)